MKWPGDRKFAFTIIDDTDCATVAYVKPVYDYLYEKRLKTTKTIWCYPSRDTFGGDTLSDKHYVDFILGLKEKGFEIAFHGAGSGDFNRNEMIQSFALMKQVLGEYPDLYINHCANKNNLYWGAKRFTKPVSFLFALLKRLIGEAIDVSYGDEKNSKYFWGDYAKEHIRYIRNRTFSKICTTKSDPHMPYREKSKDKYSNYWFSSSDAMDCEAFLHLMTDKAILKLEKSGEACIIYTHFAFGYVDQFGKLNEDFKKTIDKLSKLNGYFAPATEILDILNEQRQTQYLNSYQLFKLDCKWLLERGYRKIVRKM
jgi:hypothetical protein